MQASLGIVILARKPQVVLHRRRRYLGLAEGEVGGLPDDGAGGGDQPLRGAEMVVDEMVDTRAGLVLLHGQGFAFEVNILPLHRAVRGDVAAGVMGLGLRRGLGDLVIIRVVTVGGDPAVGGCELDAADLRHLTAGIAGVAVVENTDDDPGEIVTPVVGPGLIDRAQSRRFERPERPVNDGGDQGLAIDTDP